MALNYDEISAITEKFFAKKLTDNIFKSNPLMRRLIKSSQYKPWTGGTKIIEPVVYAVNGTAQWYTGAETLNVSDNPSITAAEFVPKQLQTSIVITRQDELTNNGPAQMVDFVRGKVQIAEKTLKDTLGTGLFSDGTTNTKSIIGLKGICSASSSYGGIDPASYSWWAAQVDSTTTSISIPAFQYLKGLATIDQDVPTLAVTTQTQWDVVFNNLQPQQRFASEDEAKAGFTSLMVCGIPLLVDSHVQSGYMYLVNEEYLNLYYASEENFRFEPFVKPVNQNVSYGHIFWMGGLTCSNRRMQSAFNALV